MTKERLITNFSSSEFLQAIADCKGNVYFCTPEGDRLALKSTLCQYIFCSLANMPDMMEKGWVEFDSKEDRYFVEEYLR